MVMHLKSCCCGCSLKTGSVIIAVLSAISGLGGLIGCILLASVASGQAFKELQSELGDIKDPKFQQELDKLQEENIYGPGMQVAFIIMAIIEGIHLIISILLIFGASAERASLVKPWIIYAIVSVVAFCILNLVLIGMKLSAGLIMNGVISLIMMGVGLTLSVYFILIVNSFHTELISNTFPNKV